MVGNVTNAKNAQEHHDFVLHEIATEAQGGSCEGVLNIIKEETVLHDPYLQRYSENPYVNAVLAGKAAYAGTLRHRFGKQCGAWRGAAENH